MGWLNVIPAPHECPTPDKEEVEQQSAAVGSVWVCDTCHKRWKLALISYGWSPTDFRDVISWVNWEEVESNG